MGGLIGVFVLFGSIVGCICGWWFVFFGGCFDLDFVSLLLMFGLQYF